MPKKKLKTTYDPRWRGWSRDEMNAQVGDLERQLAVLRLDLDAAKRDRDVWAAAHDKLRDQLIALGEYYECSR